MYVQLYIKCDKHLINKEYTTYDNRFQMPVIWQLWPVADPGVLKSGHGPRKSLAIEFDSSSSGNINMAMCILMVRSCKKGEKKCFAINFYILLEMSYKRSFGNCAHWPCFPSPEKFQDPLVAMGTNRRLALSAVFI